MICLGSGSSIYLLYDRICGRGKTLGYLVAQVSDIYFLLVFLVKVSPHICVCVVGGSLGFLLITCIPNCPRKTPELSGVPVDVINEDI